jgi:hypothetical protein
VAIPPNAVFNNNIFGAQSTTERCDLYLLFGSIAEIVSELQHRFDGLPIHRIVYYQSYNQGVLQILIAAINTRSGQRQKLRCKLNPTGNQQDCLGMTPLHILACSSVNDLELYRVIVDNYPTNLITEDRWGTLPLFYAFWGAAPAEIIQFLLESYQSIYPDHDFNWTMMVETMGRCDTPKESIEYLLHVKQMHFPDQPIDWGYLLGKFLSPSRSTFGGLLFQERMQCLFMCSMSSRVEALAFKVWRDCISNLIHSAEFMHSQQFHNKDIICTIQAKFAHFKDKYLILKEITTILELAIWKSRMSENILQEKATHYRNKIMADESIMRQQCRITCGADVIIQHVLLYLI